MAGEGQIIVGPPGLPSRHRGLMSALCGGPSSCHESRRSAWIRAVALADYHLWWAHRLHSYANEVSNNRWDLHLAGLAAGKGIRHIAAMSDVVAHVDSHVRLSKASGVQ